MSLRTIFSVARSAASRNVHSPLKNITVTPVRNFLMTTRPTKDIKPAEVWAYAAFFAVATLSFPAWVVFHVKEYAVEDSL